MITERRIRDLSFAVEALSRCNAPYQTEMRYAIERILEKEIAVAAKEQAERAEVKDMFVARDAVEAAKSQVNDEIPF